MVEVGIEMSSRLIKGLKERKNMYEDKESFGMRGKLKNWEQG